MVRAAAATWSVAFWSIRNGLADQDGAGTPTRKNTRSSAVGPQLSQCTPRGIDAGLWAVSVTRIRTQPSGPAALRQSTRQPLVRSAPSVVSLKVHTDQ